MIITASAESLSAMFAKISRCWTSSVLVRQKVFKRWQAVLEQFAEAAAKFVGKLPMIGGSVGPAA